jgi:hypothetical protein
LDGAFPVLGGKILFTFSSNTARSDECSIYAAVLARGWTARIIVSIVISRLRLFFVSIIMKSFSAYSTKNRLE